MTDAERDAAERDRGEQVQGILDELEARRPAAAAAGPRSQPMSVADAIVYLGDVISAALRIAGMGGFD